MKRALCGTSWFWSVAHSQPGLHALLGVLALPALGATLFGCASGLSDEDPLPPDPVFIDQDDASDSRSARLRIRGSLGPGESADGAYLTSGLPGWTTEVFAGEVLTALVTASDGSISQLFLYGPDRGAGYGRLRPIASSAHHEGNGSRISVTLDTPGEYLLLVRELRARPGEFRISREGTAAAPTIPVTELSSLPFAGEGRIEGASHRSLYHCMGARTHPGPESVFAVDVPVAGLLAAQATSATGSVLDVMLLTANDPTACLAGHALVTAAWVEPGRYFIAVDGTSAGDASFSLSTALTTPDQLESEGMALEVARRGLRALSIAAARGEMRRSLFIMIDFSLSSAVQRQWVVDVATSDVLMRQYVAHGSGSASGATALERATPTHFSNVSGSNATSLGMARTAETYTGSFGYSVRLDGLEPTYNGRLRARAVIIHPWGGSDPRLIRSQGYGFNTEGCLGQEPLLSTAFYDQIANGTLVWSYYPDGDWSQRSVYMQ